MKAKITGKGLVSPIGNGEKGIATPLFQHHWLTAENPEFGKYFDPKTARRTSKILKMSLVAAFDSLGGNYENIDGIIVGTGLGCIGDSEKFITSMIEYKETTLSPTPFIQSTHNTIAGTIALQLKIHKYNVTYSERIFSFEWALLDALMQLHESQESLRLLVGSADELTERTFNIAKSLNIYEDLTTQNAEILINKRKKAIAGEHAAFFTLSNSSSLSPNLHFVKMYFQTTKLQILNSLKEALRESGFNEPDCVLIGINGHQVYDKVYDPFLAEFKNSSIAYYKHLCGENFTASSFALWLGLSIFEENKLPENIVIKNANNTINNILIINHFKNDYLSAIFISR